MTVSNLLYQIAHEEIDSVEHPDYFNMWTGQKPPLADREAWLIGYDKAAHDRSYFESVLAHRRMHAKQYVVGATTPEEIQGFLHGVEKDATRFQLKKAP